MGHIFPCAWPCLCIDTVIYSYNYGFSRIGLVWRYDFMKTSSSEVLRYRYPSTPTEGHSGRYARYRSFSGLVASAVQHPLVVVVVGPKISQTTKSLSSAPVANILCYTNCDPVYQGELRFRPPFLGPRGREKLLTTKAACQSMTYVTQVRILKLMKIV